MIASQKKSPLLYTRAEVNFNDLNWDITVLANFYNAIKNQFPKKESRTNKHVQISHTQNGEIEIKEGDFENILVCKTSDEAISLHLSKNKIELIFLKNATWQDTKNLVIEMCEQYTAITQTDIFMISLKYVHKINIGEKTTYENLKNYFTFVPQIPSFTKGNNANSMQMRTEFLWGHNMLVLTLATLFPDLEMQAPVLVDILFSSLDTPDDWRLETWLEEAHNQITEVFEKSITEFTKQNYAYDNL